LLASLHTVGVNDAVSGIDDESWVVVDVHTFNEIKKR